MNIRSRMRRITELLSRPFSYVIYTQVGLYLFFIDRITKLLALDLLATPYKISHFLSFELTFNTGISWGMLHGWSSATFATVTVMTCAITAAVLWYAGVRYRHGYGVMGEVLVVSGSVSNIFDRFTHQGVIDFIYIHVGSWHWPLFNLADACIVLGVMIMIIEHTELKS